MNGASEWLTNKGRGDNSVHISTTTKYATETGVIYVTPPITSVEIPVFRKRVIKRLLD
ncbi:hypothetical protein J6590_011001 [Homalodisca vitripennis]|nr:hypothetical protein J6590_011001 [Homalodisca vitripennis]